jgi:hypothetical protein
VSTIEELLVRKCNGCSLENREHGRKDPSRWQRDTHYPQKLALTSLASCDRSVGIVRSRTEAPEFSFCLFLNSWDLLRIYPFYSYQRQIFGTHTHTHTDARTSVNTSIVVGYIVDNLTCIQSCRATRRLGTSTSCKYICLTAGLPSSPPPPLQPSGHSTYRLRQHTKTASSPHRVCLCVSFVSHNKQRLFQQTALTGLSFSAET